MGKIGNDIHVTLERKFNHIKSVYYKGVLFINDNYAYKGEKTVIISLDEEVSFNG